MAPTVRTAYKVWSGIAAGVFCLVAIADLSSDHTTPAAPAPVVTSAASPAAVAPAPEPVTPAAAAPSAPEPGQPAGGQTATVSRVIDGDTFVAGGQKVRVLGIDSCEANTRAGQEATAAATSMLQGQEVVLRAAPGVDRDRYGRELRYVEVSSSGTDVGDYMVAFDHTAVYAGRQDADPAYVAKLRSDDPNGRTCATPTPAPTSTRRSSGGGSINWPTPGDQGLPDGALTGGYCARKWWC